MRIITNLMVIGLFLGTACQTDKSPENGGKQVAEEAAEHNHAPTELVALTDDQLRIGGVEVGAVSYRNLGQSLQVNGRLAVPAQSQVNISALQGGFVRSVPLLPGQPVRKGQVLARIENPDLIQLQQEYAENHSRLTYLEAEYARQQELSRENVSAVKVLQQTRADLQATRARVTGLGQRMQLAGLSAQQVLQGRFSTAYTVVAPVSGAVTSVLVTAGQHVQPADVIATVMSTQGIYAALTVFEKDLPALHEGQRIRIQLASEAGKERTGRITYINPVLDDHRAAGIVARLDQHDGRLVPNAFLKATLDLGASRVTALPEEAIVSLEGKEYIFVVTDEKMPEEDDHEHETSAGKTEAHDDHDAHEEPRQTFRRVAVRRGVTENGYSQVILPKTVDVRKSKVVVKGAYTLLSTLKAASGEEEGHAH
ncbi:efflux RND transporter periplasmic adaptor subunit [Arsenicibacter rosenii]|nr:efflux RND transporter periplasmic adaptor subunit [Arsenicibacter rosenii]